MAIGITVTKGVPDEGLSKFFGAPAIPAAWENDFSEDVIFFCQFRLEDLAELDTENRLPHKGYLYIFLDTAEYPYQPIVRYFDGEPDTVIDDFNDIDEEFAALTAPWAMQFASVPDKGAGIRLFGVPEDWCYEEQPPELFLQYDPLAADMPFLSYVDGFVYFFRADGGFDLTLRMEQS